MLDLPGIIEGAKDGKGRGRQVTIPVKTVEASAAPRRGSPVWCPRSGRCPIVSSSLGIWRAREGVSSNEGKMALIGLFLREASESKD